MSMAKGSFRVVILYLGSSSNKQIYDEYSNDNMIEFINDLAKIHKNASLYKALKEPQQDELKKLTNAYREEAIATLAVRDTGKLSIALFNISSSLYLGDSSTNNCIQGNLDPPRKGTKAVRSDYDTDQAKILYAIYNVKGLGIRSDFSSPTKAKSSDKPPGATEDYVTIV